MTNFVQNLTASLYKGFIDQEHGLYGSHKPKLLLNNPANRENVLNTLLEELDQCQSFLFSVAFITEGGLATLKSHFLDLKRKGVKGRILTSTFLHFNQPKVFRELLKITNVEVRLTDVAGFHAKGYIFQHPSHYSLIVGSSNLTAHALKVNYEWNVKLASHENGEIVHHFRKQFEDVWQTAAPLTEEWISAYEASYRNERALPRVAEFPASYQTNSITEALSIVPNKMQEAALQGIAAIRDAGQTRGLVVSATGTGKTYLSAFDVRRFAPRRMLFVVHREQILQKAKSDFQRILGGPDQDFGILSGSSKEVSARYVFATIQTLSKDETLQHIEPEAFDYILIDEVHKAGAASYQKVMAHFQPQFLLGMTATPERTDDFNIYALFHYNIAYEIRLQEALEEDMLCPFHYFGVTDFERDGEIIDDTTTLTQLVMTERVNHVMEKIEYYGFSGERVCGLMFCSRKEEAVQLSQALNEKGYRTAALTGDHSQEERARHVERLEHGELQYILTVDIFNEGIDIPSVNQVVMLRQTQSSIIFIQQLGRGLRKHSSKDFVTIIDFIGNYKNNYLIPIALSGDRSQNKDNVRRHMKDTSYMKGVSTINFEEVAKQQIFKAISSSNLTEMKVLKEAYTELKNRLGRVPLLHDFLTNHSIDPTVLVSKHGNYHRFLCKVKEEIPAITTYENQVLTMLSQEILNGKRRHEVVLLELLLERGQVEYSEYVRELERVGCRTEEAVLKSVQRVLDLSFFTQAYQEKYGREPIVVLENGYFFFGTAMQHSLAQHVYFQELATDVVKSAAAKSRKYRCDAPFTLYEKYTRKDTCRLLNWDNDESSTMYGYKTKYQTCPIFVTYHKSDEVDASVAYSEEFLSPEVLQWSTRSKRTLQSEEVKTIIYAQRNNIDIHVFVKKDNDEGSDFYYLGRAYPDQEQIRQASMQDKEGKNIPVVHMNMVLEQGVEHQLYQYLISGEAV